MKESQTVRLLKTKKHDLPFFVKEAHDLMQQALDSK